MAEFIYTVGAGQTYTTVQAAWNAIPSSIPAEDTHIIRLMVGTYGALAPSARTNLGQIIFEAAPGAAWYEVQSYTAALNGDVWAFKPTQWQDPRAAAT